LLTELKPIFYEDTANSLGVVHLKISSKEEINASIE